MHGHGLELSGGTEKWSEWAGSWPRAVETHERHEPRVSPISDQVGQLVAQVSTRHASLGSIRAAATATTFGDGRKLLYLSMRANFQLNHGCEAGNSKALVEFVRFELGIPDRRVGSAVGAGHFMPAQIMQCALQSCAQVSVCGGTQAVNGLANGLGGGTGCHLDWRGEGGEGRIALTHSD